MFPVDYKYPMPNSNSCNCVKKNCNVYNCACFKAGQLCGVLCRCVGCKNTLDNIQEIKMRHAQKAKEQSISTATKSESVSDDGVSQLSGGPKKKCAGCKCKYNFCGTAYCPCLKNGQGCSSDCGCFNCKNPKGPRGALGPRNG